MNARSLAGLFKEAATEWSNDNASRLAAALAYYTLFSVAPLVVVAVAVAGFVFGEKAAQAQMEAQITGLVGPEGASLIRTAVENASKPTHGTIAGILGVVALLFGATGAFAALKDSLNTIWNVKPPENGGVKFFLQTRVLSFAMVLVIGFLLLVSLVASAVLAGIEGWLAGIFPGLDVLLRIANIVLSFAIVTVLFALMFRLLPDVKVAWSDVWLGAAVTALLFTLGKTLIGLYLGQASVGSVYGAAGSLVILLVWVNYSALILFFGAELTQVYARRHGSHIKARRGASLEQGEWKGMSVGKKDTHEVIPHPLGTHMPPPLPGDDHARQAHQGHVAMPPWKPGKEALTPQLYNALPLWEKTVAGKRVKVGQREVGQPKDQRPPSEVPVVRSTKAGPPEIRRGEDVVKPMSGPPPIPLTVDPNRPGILKKQASAARGRPRVTVGRDVLDLPEVGIPAAYQDPALRRAYLAGLKDGHEAEAHRLGQQGSLGLKEVGAAIGSFVGAIFVGWSGGKRFGRWKGHREARKEVKVEAEGLDVRVKAPNPDVRPD